MTVTNFYGSSNTTDIPLSFLNEEGLIWRDIVNEYVVNPSLNFTLGPKVAITAMNMTKEIIDKIPRIVI